MQAVIRLCPATTGTRHITITHDESNNNYLHNRVCCQIQKTFPEHHVSSSRSNKSYIWNIYKGVKLVNLLKLSEPLNESAPNRSHLKTECNCPN